MINGAKSSLIFVLKSNMGKVNWIFLSFVFTNTQLYQLGFELHRPLYVQIWTVQALSKHYKKKMGFRPRLKNAAIDPKNAAIG